jgi:hypothetical protein
MIRIKSASFDYGYYLEDETIVIHEPLNPMVCGSLKMELYNTTSGYVELLDLWIDQAGNKIEGNVVIDTMNKTLLKLNEFERWQAQTIDYYINISTPNPTIHPPYIIPFQVAYIPCRIEEISHSFMKDVKHKFPSDRKEEAFLFPVIETTPDCGYEPVITTYWSDNSQSLPPGMIDWEYDKNKDRMFYYFNAVDKAEEGEYMVTIRVDYPTDPFYFFDDSWEWMLTNEFLGYPSTNMRIPNYDMSVFPDVIRLNVGDVLETTTGPASLDTAAVNIDVYIKGEWEKFLQYEIDDETWEIKLTFNAVSTDFLGEHQLRIEMVDNSSDNDRGKPEDEQSHILMNRYVITIIVSAKPIVVNIIQE